MSFPISAFKDQADQIKDVLAMNSDIKTAIAMETNKRVVLCVLSKLDADIIKTELIRAGFYVTYSKGLKTTRRYLSINYKYPSGY